MLSLCFELTCRLSWLTCANRWSEDNTDTITAIFAVLVIFVILVLVGSVLMWRRVKSLKLDPKQYGPSAATTHGVEVRLGGSDSYGTQPF